jgi:hypothetical protein
MRFLGLALRGICLMAVILVIARLGYGQESQFVHEHDAGQSICQKSNVTINVAVGWTVERAKQESAALAKPETAGFDAGLSSYVYQPGSLEYQGGIPLHFSCPRMVSVSAKNGLISSVQVFLDSDDPGSLDKAMDLAASWEAKLNGMGLENLSANKAENVTPAQDVPAFFKLTDSPLSMTAGKVLGAWLRQDEKISVGVERWNTAPSTFSRPKYIYVIEVVISKYPLAKEKVQGAEGEG